MLKGSFHKWPVNQKVALPILTVLAFGMLMNSLSKSSKEPVSIAVANAQIIDGDTFATANGKRVRIIGMDAPDEDGKGSMMKIAAQLYLEELIKQNGEMDCTSAFEDKQLAQEGICRERRSSYGRMNLSCHFRKNGASVAATMVRHGYAVDYREFSGLAYAGMMKDAARDARGLWGVDYRAMRELAIKRGELSTKCDR